MSARATLAFVGICALAAAQTPQTGLVIRGAMVVDGSGTPAAGPKDIVIENNTIASIEPFAARQPGEVDIEPEARSQNMGPGRSSGFWLLATGSFL